MPKTWRFLLKFSDRAASVGAVCLAGGFTITAVGYGSLWANQGFLAAYSIFGISLASRILAVYTLGRQGTVRIATSPDALRAHPYGRGFVRTENLKTDVIKKGRGLTEAQRDLLFQGSYYGMWARLSGEVVSVSGWTGSGAEVKLRIYSWWRADAVLKFSDQGFYRNHLSAFRPKKTHVTVIGRIAKITFREIIIHDCEALPAA